MVDQGCSYNLRQPSNGLFEPGKKTELYHKSGANSKFFPLSATKRAAATYILMIC